MTISYPAIFHKEDNSYWGNFPDLESIQAYIFFLGKTVEGAIADASEALTGCLETMDLSNLPAPSNPESIHPDDGFVKLVTVEIQELQAGTCLPSAENNMAAESAGTLLCVPTGDDEDDILPDGLAFAILEAAGIPFDEVKDE